MLEDLNSLPENSDGTRYWDITGYELSNVYLEGEELCKSEQLLHYYRLGSWVFALATALDRTRKATLSIRIVNDEDFEHPAFLISLNGEKSQHLDSTSRWGKNNQVVIGHYAEKAETKPMTTEAQKPKEIDYMVTELSCAISSMQKAFLERDEVKLAYWRDQVRSRSDGLCDHAYLD